MSKVLHIVPGLEDVANGMATVAQMLAKEQGDANVVDLREGVRAIEEDEAVEEVWVHGLWLPGIWRACLKALRLGKRLVRMPHGSLSPVYLQHQSRLKKRLASPVERYLLNKAHKVVATCAAEKEWILKYAPQVKQTEVADLKRFFDFGNREPTSPRLRRSRQGLGNREPAHLLYLGRKHPLKGWEYLERAVKGIKGVGKNRRQSGGGGQGPGLEVVRRIGIAYLVGKFRVGDRGGAGARQAGNHDRWCSGMGKRGRLWREA